MKNDIHALKAIAEIYADINRKNQWGIVMLWRGIPEYEIDYQVEKVVEANHKMKMAIAQDY